jgi:glycosyltransferase involved in cell wall biosynthesis
LLSASAALEDQAQVKPDNSDENMQDRDQRGRRFLETLRAGVRRLADWMLWHPRNRRRMAAVNMHDWAIADLSMKLRRGFRRQAGADLLKIVESAPAPERRVFAAWELARFCAVRGDWPSTVGFLRRILKWDSNFLIESSGGFLLTEALLETGQPDHAMQVAEEMRSKMPRDPDCNLALENVHLFTRTTHAGDDAEMTVRLALLDELYVDNQLAKVDIAAKNGEFAFRSDGIGAAAVRAIDDPKMVSILLTASHANELDQKVIGSILQQSWRNLQLIIIDCGPAESGSRQAWPIEKSDARVNVASLNSTNSLHDARLAALSLAKGDYILAWDRHLLAHPQMLHLLVGALRSSPDVMMAFPGVATMSTRMRFSLSAIGNSLSYVGRLPIAHIARSRDFWNLGAWDEIEALAAAELVQRAAIRWGGHSLADVEPAVPLAFRVGLSNETTRLHESGTDIADVDAAAEYLKQAAYWAKREMRKGCGTDPAENPFRASRKIPFPVPHSLFSADGGSRQVYDLIIISDLTLLGGTRRCNQGYLRAALRLGIKTGLYHWPRYDLSLKSDIATVYRELNELDDIDILTACDHAAADFVLIHHPPILKVIPDRLPDIETARLGILVNQLPWRPSLGEECYYDRVDAEAECVRVFRKLPTWLPISPVVRRLLVESGYSRLAPEDWIPPLGDMVDLISAPRTGVPDPGRPPVVGRHGRDHWTKWPASDTELRQAYCADTGFPVRFLGGCESVRERLSKWPGNWHSAEFDSVPVTDFLAQLDFLVHFTHPDYIEEFGRNVMEAMAAGVPVLLPCRFRETFGDAACYCDPEQVAGRIEAMWADESSYREQAARGLRFARHWAGDAAVERRLADAVSGRLLAVKPQK